MSYAVDLHVRSNRSHAYAYADEFNKWSQRWLTTRNDSKFTMEWLWISWPIRLLEMS